jgi:dTDP-4-dehydrorhamnose 3,5-epimerase
LAYEKICPNLHLDKRGSLFEIYSKAKSYNLSPKHMYISRSSKGVVRGFHQQIDIPQKKMIYCLSGEVADYVVNIDAVSCDYGVVDGYLLSGQAGEGVIIGRNFAHGFECLSDECTLLYICDDHYSPAGQLNINPLDEAFATLWATDSPLLSTKDCEGRSLQEAKKLLLQNFRK